MPGATGRVPECVCRRSASAARVVTTTSPFAAHLHDACRRADLALQMAAAIAPWACRSAESRSGRLPFTTDRSKLPCMLAGSSRSNGAVRRGETESRSDAESHVRGKLDVAVRRREDSGPDTFVASTSPLAVCALTPAVMPSTFTDPFDVSRVDHDIGRHSAMKPRRRVAPRWKRLNIVRKPPVFFPR